MSDATIRPAEPGDIAAVGGIYAEAVKNGTATFETDPPDEAEMARLCTLCSRAIIPISSANWAASLPATPTPVLFMRGRPIVGR
jgi:L-amino acid N-acyltransferase YncA